MQFTEAFVSGSLGQAVYRDGSACRIIDAPNAEPLDALPNEVQWFHYSAREVAPAHPEGLPVSIDWIRTRLDEEIRFFGGLDGLLVGMDSDFSEATRGRAILRAEDMLAADDAVARRIRHRFLIPVNTQQWDPVGGLALALRKAAKAAADCYRFLADRVIDRLVDDVSEVVHEKLGNGLEAIHASEAILQSGILGELAPLEAGADRAAVSALLFRRSEFTKLQAVDPSGQILTAIVGRIYKRSTPTLADMPLEAQVADKDQNSEAFGPSDPIITALDRARVHIKERRSWSTQGTSADLPAIQRQIAWIGDTLRSGATERAEQALIKLIDRQGRRCRAEDIVKTLTAVADLSRGAKLFEWTLRLLAATGRMGRADAAVMCVRAETLRDLGRYEEALAAFEDTMGRFPYDEVAPTARAETLRDLGRYEEALAAFEDTMGRFPYNEVAPTARAETCLGGGQVE